jgi:2-succinyl-5-enolpyruvyl-6-hydroxy-3-cyclohexene-1-carboxylate synthase
MNDPWAFHFIDTLSQLGIERIFIAPGSRSTPLVIAAARHPKIKTTVHYDERGTAFAALGFGKAAKRPAALITTSGTAVGNILPAMMEADAFNIPLLAITADRPFELRDTSANQTTDQVKLFQNFARWQIDIPPPSSDVDLRHLSSLLSYALFQTRTGPVHLNCMFREPLFSPGPHLFSPQHLITRYDAAEPKLSSGTLKSCAAIINRATRGIILACNDLQNADVQSLAEKLGWPIFDDILSGLRSKNVTCYYELFLDLFADQKPDCVLQLGNRFTSKRLAKWVEKSESYLLVSASSQRIDPSCCVTDRIVASPADFCSEILPFIETKPSSAFSFKEAIEPVLEESKAFSEAAIFYRLSKLLDKNWSLFLANSMPIRDANAFFYPKQPIKAIYSNRGVSGIDGNIATACGIAIASRSPLLAIIGDQTALHDLNSLALMREVDTPLIFLIMNNGGGRIFDHLPIGKEDLCNTHFAAAHSFNFKSAAELFNIPYFEEFDAIPSYSCIIEAKIDQAVNLKAREKILARIKEELSCLT